MASFISLRKVVSCQLSRRCMSTSTLLRQSSNGHSYGGLCDGKSQNRYQHKQKLDHVRYQSNKPKSADDTISVSMSNRQRYINNNVLETIDLSPLDDIHKDGVFTRNIENYIGTVKIPIGMVNVDVNGMYAKGSFSVPMATTEAALVASYSRGCKLVSVCGGINTVVVEKTVQRAPEFLFANISDANIFYRWFNRPEMFDRIKKAAETTTNYGKLKKTAATLHGNKVLTKFMYETGNASGQNISTFATNVAITEFLQDSPIQPQKWWLDAGGSQDKKASSGLFNNSRGVYVTGEVICPKDAVEQILKTTVDNLNEISESVTISQYMQGVTGLTCHAANALTAIFIACGQDVACVVESHVGVTEMRKTPEGDLRVRLTIPSMMIGTVGGGTDLPSQNTCLSMIQLPEENSRDALAEVIMGVLLGGELSLSAAMTAHHFSAAHKKFARSGVTKRV
ncbi:3-hydroxy-3-methylglutaryl-coenzyme A reductase 1-like [Antedon mediterranea]|uniref:3-hydroxy-3-methylglutaryl-coenzyme A reductase 1-like n=1 Tax=Antedon mediterranea TaxID=105859 RepID=UPI003AF709A1